MAKMNQLEKFFVNSRLQYYLHRWFGFGRFLEKLPSTSYGDILEIGAGVGFTSQLLSEKYPNARILATDFDEGSIEIAKQKKHSSNISFHQADATKLTLSDSQFDAAFSILALHHIHDFENAIAELARIVKRDGDVYIMDMPSASFNFTHFRRNVVPGVFTKSDLIKIGERHGLKMQDCGGKYLFKLCGKKYDKPAQKICTFS